MLSSHGSQRSLADSPMNIENFDELHHTGDAKLKLADNQFQYVTEDSVLNMSIMSRGNILNRMNSKSILEASSYRNDFDMIDDNLSQHVFDQRNLRSMLRGGHLTPVSIPQIGLKKGMVSQQTLNMMKKKIQGTGAK